MTMTYQKEICKVSDIPEDFIFVSDLQDIKPIREQFKEAKDYSSFFVSMAELERGALTFVYGLTGNIPYIWVNCFLITK